MTSSLIRANGYIAYKCDRETKAYVLRVEERIG
jgi:hypothetical protein